jgi:hypothetical protein
MSINRRDVGVVGAGIVALTASVVVTAVVLLVFTPVSPRQAIHDWLQFVPLPGLVVFGASRSGIFRTRPWLLLLVGPLAFVIAALGLVMTHSILFAPAILVRKAAVPARDARYWPRVAGFARYALDAASSLSGVTLSGSIRTIR